MTYSKWIGTAVGLALLSVALPSCSVRNNSSVQQQSGSAQPDAPQLEWSGKVEKQLLDAIAQAPANGLKPDLFLKGDLPKDDNERSQVLTQAALRYAQALAHGFADPTKLTKDYTVPRPGDDVRKGLAQAIQQGNVDQWLASLPPQTDEYRALSEAHLNYLKMAQGANFQEIGEGKPIKPGSRDPRVPAVAAALRSVDYLPPQQANAPAETHYSGALVAAVKKLQGDFGIKADGIIGDTTLDALNLGPGGRARMLAIAMERLRWLQRDPPGTRIDVNTAATFLDYWRDGQHIDHRNVVAGEPDKQTPQLQAPIFQLVANPKWRVPDSIVDKELKDKSPTWLADNNFTVENGKYVQEAGDKNSLGLTKFDMDDPQQIYLHDTPAKALFTLPERHRSHGCVRVQNAIEFATMLAEQDGVLDQYEKALTSGEESYVKLKTRIPVRLLYHTAFWDGSTVQFRPDVYGWDQNVAQVLGLVRGLAARQIQQGPDIGP
jgi:murein L,D-transpeptidase YcbB/YkuD